MNNENLLEFLKFVDSPMTVKIVIGSDAKEVIGTLDGFRIKNNELWLTAFQDSENRELNRLLDKRWRK